MARSLKQRPCLESNRGGANARISAEQRFSSSNIKDDFPLVTFQIFHPSPDPTSNVRQNLVVYPVVLAECCVFMFLALGWSLFFRSPRYCPHGVV